MRYIWQHINTILESYTGDLPLAHYLKNYFKQNPKLGSRDRKILSAMAYSWYRCSKGIEGKIVFEEKIITCLQLCKNDIPALIAKEGITIPGVTQFNEDQLFPYGIALSEGINKKEWQHSMLEQPKLFIRVRKDKGKVISLLNEKDIPFTFVSDTCLALPNGANIDTVLPQDCYVVQDASSQQTGAYFTPKKNELWLDCCSGAGGKSLLLKDKEPGVRLTVTDKRESIIHNLQQRFRQYGHELPVAHVTDTSNKEQLHKTLGTKRFDYIICDVPCSGSGTWARTPEQMYFFTPAILEKYTAIQKEIAINVAAYLKTGGSLIYITCSVFKQENEETVQEIINQAGLTLTESHLINGIPLLADSMFIAILKK
jgi:16S rRNA (cytosine967-C5)-methyltransferase